MELEIIVFDIAHNNTAVARLLNSECSIKKKRETKHFYFYTTLNSLFYFYFFVFFYIFVYFFQIMVGNVK